MKLVLLLLVAGVAVARAGVLGTFGEKVHQGAVKIDEKITSFLGGHRPPGPPGPPGLIHRHQGPLTHGLAGNPQGPPSPLHRPSGPIPIQPQAPPQLAPVAPQYQPQVPQRPIPTTQRTTTTVADDDDDLAADVINNDTVIEPSKPEVSDPKNKDPNKVDDRHIIDAHRCDVGKIWIEDGCRALDD